jgi:peptide/nickel transport system permease protein
MSAVAVERAAARSRRRGGLAGIVRAALGTWRGRIGLALFLLVALVAFVGPYVTPHDPTDFVGRALAAPSGDAPLGTDALGRDVLSRFLDGGRTLLLLSLTATLVGVAVGVLIGVVAAGSRPLVDEGIMRSLDVVLSFPQIVFALLVLSIAGADLWLVGLVVVAVQAPQVARVCRGAALGVRSREFVAYARTIGLPRRRVLLTEVVPNVSTPILVEVGFRLTFSIGMIAALSFLGLGVQRPQADWGLMISENRPGLLQQPLGVIAPVVAIALLTIGVNLLADAIARAAIGIERSAREAPR